MSILVDFPPECVRRHDGCGLNMMPDISAVHTSERRRTVRFSPTSTLLSYVVPQEQQRCASSSWYSTEDENLFKLQAKEEIMMLQRMKEDGCDINKLYPFGLEQQLISSLHTKQRKVTRKLVTLAVLTEQGRPPWHRGDDMVERIASASRQHSEWSRFQAQAIGSYQAISDAYQ